MKQTGAIWLSGFIAKVQCTEVWCEMTRLFLREICIYLQGHEKGSSYIMNPTKVQACQYLIEMHETMGEGKVIVFDNIFAIKHY
jgi:DNA excision repair protein ERCC-3